MIEAAILGLGRWGQALVSAMAGHQTLRFVAAVDPARERVAGFAARHGLRLLDGLDAVLATPGIGAVVIATPHSQHLAQVLACAAARKAVFCEKPLALDLGEARRMAAACRAAGVPLAVGHNRRFWPAMRELERMVRAGELGEVLHAEAHNSNLHSDAVLEGWRLDPAESVAGGMTGAGLHALHALIALLGPVRRVQARQVLRAAGPPVRDTVSLMLDFPGGVSAQMATVRATPLFWRTHVFGTAASAEVTGETELVLRRGTAPPERLTFPAVDPLRAELEAFADLVTAGTPFPVAEAEALATVAALGYVSRAIEGGVAVEGDG
jgi:predicted dehydrogenase